jgi:hypothetical protein
MIVGARLVSVVLILATSSVPAVAAPLSSGHAPDVSIVRILAALLFSLIVAAAAILLIRQRGGKVDLGGLVARFETRRRAIHVVETRRLSPHADICIVRHGGSEYLLLLMAGDARVLSERADADSPSEAARP